MGIGGPVFILIVHFPHVPGVVPMTIATQLPTLPLRARLTPFGLPFTLHY